MAIPLDDYSNVRKVSRCDFSGRVAVLNCGSISCIEPSARITAVIPLLVERNNGRPNSNERIRAIWKCCHGPIDWPNHASFETVKVVAIRFKIILTWS